MSELKKVVYIGPEDAMSAVSGQLDEQYSVIFSEPTPEAVTEALKDAHVFLDASMKVRIEKDMIEQATSLKLVITATTGADHIDSKTLEAKGIPLLTLKGQKEILNKVTPAAEHSWLLLMACARNVKAALNHVDQGLWDRAQFPGIMLRGKTLGVIGCGRIGQWMARYAEAFEMKSLGYDPFIESWPEHIEKVPLETLLKECDFLGVHVNYSEETHHLLGRNELEQCKQGVVIVNTARGAVIDEGAMLDLLKSKQIGAVGLDVLSEEPDITESALWEYSKQNSNCLITPHIGGFSPDALAMVLAFTADRIANYFNELN